MFPPPGNILDDEHDATENRWHCEGSENPHGNTHGHLDTAVPEEHPDTDAADDAQQ